MYGGIGDGINTFIITILVLLVAFLPLGMWKLIEILIWFFKHLSWGE